MAHQSENAKRLSVRIVDVADMEGLPQPSEESAEVWLFVLPFEGSMGDAGDCSKWFSLLQQFCENLHDESVVAILTSPQDAAQTWPQLSRLMQFQLWIAVKLAKTFSGTKGELPQHHAAFLILTKYRKSLRHTKTRMAYTYCPACDKTTKDYGGKKHTYHEYGTLVSDVWRDITYTRGEFPTEISTRVADLFGLPPYETLSVVNLSEAAELKKKRTASVARAKRSAPHSPQLKSQLIHGDSLVELRQIPANSVDFCYADPPYNLAKRYDSWDDALDVQEYLVWCDSWLDELARVLRPGCTCAVLNIPILAIRHLQHMQRSLKFQSWIVWEGLSLPVRMIMPAHYATVCFTKGNARALPGLVQPTPTDDETAALTTLREDYCLRKSCVKARARWGEQDRQPITDLWWDIHRLKHNSRRVDHPCQLPPALMRRLIALFTYEDEIVLDPFNGAGTTTLCAAALSRRYIGIELSDQYHQTAVDRHRRLNSGEDPFAKARRVPKAKNSRVDRIGGVTYEVPKKTLQLEVRRVAKLLGRLPTRDELQQHGEYPIRYYDEYFISWGEVCAAARHAGMSETRPTGAKTTTSQQLTLFDDD